MSLPWMKFYTGDWMKDPALGICSPATRGIWIELLCAMHNLEKAAISGTSSQLSRLTRCSPEEMESAIAELKSSKAANVSCEVGIYTILCRRRVKDADISAKRSNAVSQRYNKTPTNDLQKPYKEATNDLQTGIQNGFKTLISDICTLKSSEGKGTGEGAAASRAAELELQRQGPPGEADDGAPPLAEALKVKIGTMFSREPGIMWDYSEESRLVEICVQRARTVLKEFGEIEKFKKRLEPQDLKFHFPGTVLKLLEGWSGYIDKARNYVPEKENHESNKRNGGNPRNNFPQHKETAGDVLRMRAERERQHALAGSEKPTAGA